MSALFSALQIGALELPNRIVVSPMCQYSAREGQANEWHMQHLMQLALSGAGLVMVEATATTLPPSAAPDPERLFYVPGEHHPKNGTLLGFWVY
ncbi:oxidoreductase, partial [Bordetella pertussis]